jgi:O-antigen/teichoic acid export membrane protein
VVRRDGARDRNNTNQYFVTGSLGAAATSLVALLFLLVFLKVMGYSQDTVNIVLLVSFGIIPFSLSAICEAIFQAWEQVRFITVANVPLNIIRGALAWWLLARTGDLLPIGWLILATYMVTFLMEWGLYTLFITRPKLEFDLSFAWTLLKSSTTFLALQTVIAVLGSFLLIVISKITSEANAGFYNAANQLMAPIILFCQSVAMSLFPTLCRRHDAGLPAFKRFSTQLAEFLNVFTLPAAVGLFILADPILLLLYGNSDFLAASVVLRITAWNLVVKGLTSVLGRMLIASQREKILFRILLVELAFHVILGISLTLWLGLIGASIATLMTALLEIVLHWLPVHKVVGQFNLGAAFWKPLAASLAMALYLLLVLQSGMHVLLMLLSAAVVYGAFWLVISAWSSGGLRQFKTAFIQQWTE